ncbi:histidine phosphatase family protein [Oscillospiraceae bacterium LTW-04]|nr:histidine phosphatase family protein [Oscillospiraceae bacterium MB24-C1]
MVTYKLHLIRHGMTEGNRVGRYVGRMDIPICKEGREELLMLKEKYEYPAVQEVYCSPLLRCIQTAEILYPDEPRTVVEDLMELSLGDFEGKYIDALQEDPAYLDWIANSLHSTPPGALETSEQFGARIGGALNAIFMNMTQNRITEAAIIAHGGVFMGLLAAFAMPRAPMGEWALGNGTGYTIRMSTGLWMRDQVVEVIGSVPVGLPTGRDPRVMGSLGIKL